MSEIRFPEMIVVSGDVSPTLIDLVQELRREVGLFDGAMDISPKQGWEEAIQAVRRLREAAEG